MHMRTIGTRICDWCTTTDYKVFNHLHSFTCLGIQLPFYFPVSISVCYHHQSGDCYFCQSTSLLHPLCSLFAPFSSLFPFPFFFSFLFLLSFSQDCLIVALGVY